MGASQRSVFALGACSLCHTSHSGSCGNCENTWWSLFGLESVALFPSNYACLFVFQLKISPASVTTEGGDVFA